MSVSNNSRRKFIKAAAYTAPVILTLKAAPTYANSGSGVQDKCDHTIRRELKSRYGSKLKEKERYGSKLKERYGSKLEKKKVSKRLSKKKVAKKKVAKS